MTVDQPPKSFNFQPNATVVTSKAAPTVTQKPLFGIATSTPSSDVKPLSSQTGIFGADSNNGSLSFSQIAKQTSVTAANTSQGFGGFSGAGKPVRFFLHIFTIICFLIKFRYEMYAQNIECLFLH